jgi:PAS domain S-box-containing protein
MPLMDSKKQILVVEDEELAAAEIRQQLERLGYPVPAIATSGEEALCVARSTALDLVLVDIHLKGEVDGIAAVRALKQDLHLPVVYIGAHADQGMFDRAAVTEPLAYILKPVTSGDLRSALQLALYKHEMERRLRASEAWLATTLRSVGEGIVATDANGDIVFMNPVAEQLSGWSATDAHGRPLMSVLTLSQEPECHPANSPIFDLADGERRACTLIAASGISTHIEVECFANRSTQELLGSIVVVRDIRVRKEMEARLMQSQQMEAIAGTAGGLAHDFNNQLTVILGHVAELRERLEGELREDAQAIYHAASTASTLTGQLLTLSRRDLSRPEVINVNEVVRELEPAITHILGPSTKAILHFDLPAGFVRGDRNQLKQVLLNLALNARDAMPNGGELHIESGVIEMCNGSAAAPLKRPGPWVQLRVSDTGAGMDQATLSRIFEPFFTTRRTEFGAGLGLSIVHGIVTQAGGTITASSKPGSGSTFEILLPCVGAFVESNDSSAPTILLVEDEDSVRRLMHKFLEREGYHLLEARTAEEAANLAEVFTPRIDLLITDVIMPGMTGPQLASRLTSQCGEIRTLFVSGYRHDTLEHQGLLDRRLHLLAKPFPAAELLEHVRICLDQDPVVAR